MKRLNRKGFTLIELLAVITIMGILMLVAIPAVSRTIENARRDTFQDVAKEYINAVRNGMLADNIHCVNNDSAVSAEANGGTSTTENNTYVNASALLSGTYYFTICSEKAKGIASCSDDVVSYTTDLMESGGTSPFGNAGLVGYVQIDISSGSKDDDYSKTEYKIQLADTGKHGFSGPKKEEQINRAAVMLKNAKIAKKPDNANALPCKLT